VDFESLSRAVGISENTPVHLPEFTLKAFFNTVIPSNIADPFINNNVVAIVFLALLVGSAIRSLKKLKLAKKELPFIENLISGGFTILTKALGMVIHIVPFAAFAIIAKVVGTSGLKIFVALGVFVTIVTL